MNPLQRRMFEGKTILVFGGTGSLGHAIVSKHIEKNNITIYSRDENKHWKMSLDYKTKNLSFIIGDIRDKERVQTAIRRVNPHYIIIASALKHIDRVEFSIHESVETNFVGTTNVLNAVEKDSSYLTNLECVLFVSSDKACEPTNVYGMCKALSEAAMVERSLYMKNIKFVTIRYGNVLNSRGSIIPLLHEKGKDAQVDRFTLTHKEMTRFVMTLEQSVSLIEHAIQHAESGDIVLYGLVSMYLHDLFEIFSDVYGKPIEIGTIRPGEKLHESLISETQAHRLLQGKDGYFYIKPPYKTISSDTKIMNYTSMMNPLSKEELRTFLENIDLLHS
jgi:UDP-N-acetylglucosamine 4,6-dehydratase